MNKETLRMQMLAGIITESQYKEKIEENNVEGINASQVKSLIGDPNVRKLSAKLKSDPELLKNTIKFISKYADKEVPLNEDSKIYFPNKVTFQNGIPYFQGLSLNSYSSQELSDFSKFTDDVESLAAFKDAQAKKEKQEAEEKAEDERQKAEYKKRKQMTTKDKWAAIARSVGIPAAYFATMAGFVDINALNDPSTLVATLAASLIGLGIGALSTKGFKEKAFVSEEEMSVEDQIQKIIDLGRQM